MSKIRYGDRVVGKDAVLAAEVEKKRSTYGPKVMGESVTPEILDDAAAAREAAAAELAAQKGTGQQGVPVDPEDGFSSADFDALLDGYSNDDGYVSIGDIKKALLEAPDSFDRMMAWELNRADGSRVGALTHLLKIETKREDGPRALVLDNLSAALVAARAPGSSE